MPKQKTNTLLPCLLLLACLASGHPILAQDSADSPPVPKSVLALIDSETVGIAWLDLNRVDIGQVLDMASRWSALSDAELAVYRQRSEVGMAQLAELKGAGVNRVFAILRTSDLASGAPLLIVSVADEADPDQAAQRLDQWLQANSPPGLSELVQSRDIRGHLIRLAGSDNRLEPNQTAGDAPRTLPAEIWNAFSGQTFGLVLFGSPDSRRVLRELLPPLPAPFESIDGALIADRVQWMGLGGNINDKGQLMIHAQTDQPAAAQTLATGWRQLLNWLAENPPEDSMLPAPFFKIAAESLKPQVAGNRLTVTTELLAEKLAGTDGAAKDAILSLRRLLVPNQRLSRLRQLALAMLNHESAYSKMPANYPSAQEQGEPQLSWRVHILPFYGQEAGTLYQQFHLDEPWDSEHNLPLVKQMPRVYYDPDPNALQANLAGKTVFQTPTGAHLINDGARLRGFKEVTDGSSNSILAVVTAPDQAVIWTKPADWQPDLEKPTVGLASPGRTQVEGVMMDGSTHQFELGMPADTWRKILQIDDGAAVRW